jgi:vacuolar-type H+-ATPase subunit I/STV1
MRYWFTWSIRSLKSSSIVLDLLTIVSIEPTTYAKTPQLTNMESIAKSFSIFVYGEISPYPTVVIVVNA